jgi:hypothetical protein
MQVADYCLARKQRSADRLAGPCKSASRPAEELFMRGLKGTQKTLTQKVEIIKAYDAPNQVYHVTLADLAIVFQVPMQCMRGAEGLH